MSSTYCIDSIYGPSPWLRQFRFGRLRLVTTWRGGSGGPPSCLMDRFCQGRNGTRLATLIRWDSYDCVCHFQVKIVKATRQSVVSSSLDIAHAQTIKQVDRNTSCTSYGLPVSVEIYPFDVRSTWDLKENTANSIVT